MINFIPAIAQVNKQDRLRAILQVLNEHSIPYVKQALPCGYGELLGNIIVTFNPGISAKKVVLSAHYDNVPGTPGANDNAAACSILLNLILAAQEKGTDKWLEFVFFDMEESGLVGSRTYLQQNYGKLDCVYNLDMCGMGSNTVAAFYNGSKAILGSQLSDVHEVGNLPCGDAYTFRAAGIPTVYVVNATDRDVEWFTTYGATGRVPGQADFMRTMHQANDTPATCNLAQVEKICKWVGSSIAL